jgi:hypothetical protein
MIPKDLAAQSQNLPPKVPPKIITELAPSAGGRDLRAIVLGIFLEHPV